MGHAAPRIAAPSRDDPFLQQEVGDTTSIRYFRGYLGFSTEFFFNTLIVCVCVCVSVTLPDCSLSLQPVALQAHVLHTILKHFSEIPVDFPNIVPYSYIRILSQPWQGDHAHLASAASRAPHGARWSKPANAYVGHTGWLVRPDSHRELVENLQDPALPHPILVRS